jgi:hypothetical protein
MMNKNERREEEIEEESPQLSIKFLNSSFQNFRWMFFFKLKEVPFGTETSIIH